LGSHWDKAIARLTDDELEAVEEVVGRFDGLRNISYRELSPTASSKHSIDSIRRSSSLWKNRRYQ
jgi:hypothetical protein